MDYMAYFLKTDFSLQPSWTWFSSPFRLVCVGCIILLVYFSSVLSLFCAMRMRKNPSDKRAFAPLCFAIYLYHTFLLRTNKMTMSFAFRLDMVFSFTPFMADAMFFGFQYWTQYCRYTHTHNHTCSHTHINININMLSVRKRTQFNLASKFNSFLCALTSHCAAVVVVVVSVALALFSYRFYFSLIFCGNRMRNQENSTAFSWVHIRHWPSKAYMHGNAIQCVLLLLVC